MFTGRRPRAFQFVAVLALAILGQEVFRRKKYKQTPAWRATARPRPPQSKEYQGAVAYTGSASTMLVGRSVGMTRSSLNPAALSNFVNSFSVRSLPPVMTSIFRSMNFEK